MPTASRFPSQGQPFRPALPGSNWRSSSGRRTREQLPALPKQTHRFTWDGKDAYGRRLQGAVPITVRLSYVYPAVYAEPAEIERAFATFPTSALTGNPARDEISISRDWSGRMGAG